MYIFLFFILLLAMIVRLIFVKPMKLSFQFDSEKMDMYFVLTWLPLIRVETKVIHFRAHISIYIFNTKMVSKFAAKRWGQGKTNLEALELKNTCVRVYYGMNEPYKTGIFCGAMSVIGSLIHAESLELFPEFLPETEYLKIEAKSDLKIGKTIMNAMKIKKTMRRKNYGSV